LVEGNLKGSMDQKAIEAKRAGAEYLRKLQGLGKPDRSSSVALLDKIKEAAKKGIKYIPEPGKLGALSGVLGVASLLKSGDMLAATPIGASTTPLYNYSHYHKDL